MEVTSEELLAGAMESLDNDKIVAEEWEKLMSILSQTIEEKQNVEYSQFFIAMKKIRDSINVFSPSDAVEPTFPIANLWRPKVLTQQERNELIGSTQNTPIFIKAINKLLVRRNLLLEMFAVAGDRSHQKEFKLLEEVTVDGKQPDFLFLSEVEGEVETHAIEIKSSTNPITALINGYSAYTKYRTTFNTIQIVYLYWDEKFLRTVFGSDAGEVLKLYNSITEKSSEDYDILELWKLGKNIPAVKEFYDNTFEPFEKVLPKNKEEMGEYLKLEKENCFQRFLSFMEESAEHMRGRYSDSKLTGLLFKEELDKYGRHDDKVSDWAWGVFPPVDCGNNITEDDIYLLEEYCKENFDPSCELVVVLFRIRELWERKVKLQKHSAELLVNRSKLFKEKSEMRTHNNEQDLKLVEIEIERFDTLLELNDDERSKIDTQIIDRLLNHDKDYSNYLEINGLNKNHTGISLHGEGKKIPKSSEDRLNKLENNNYKELGANVKLFNQLGIASWTKGKKPKQYSVSKCKFNIEKHMKFLEENSKVDEGFVNIGEPYQGTGVNNILRDSGTYKMITEVLTKYYNSGFRHLMESQQMLINAILISSKLVKSNGNIGSVTPFKIGLNDNVSSFGYVSSHPNLMTTGAFVVISKVNSDLPEGVMNTNIKKIIRCKDGKFLYIMKPQRTSLTLLEHYQKVHSYFTTTYIRKIINGGRELSPWLKSWAVISSVSSITTLDTVYFLYKSLMSIGNFARQTLGKKFITGPITNVRDAEFFRNVISNYATLMENIKNWKNYGIPFEDPITKSYFSCSEYTNKSGVKFSLPNLDDLFCIAYLKNHLPKQQLRSEERASLEHSNDNAEHANNFADSEFKKNLDKLKQSKQELYKNKTDLKEFLDKHFSGHAYSNEMITKSNRQFMDYRAVYIFTWLAFDGIERPKDLDSVQVFEGPTPTSVCAVITAEENNEEEDVKAAPMVGGKRNVKVYKGAHLLNKTDSIYNNVKTMPTAAVLQMVQQKMINAAKNIVDNYMTKGKENLKNLVESFIPNSLMAFTLLLTDFQDIEQEQFERGDNLRRLKIVVEAVLKGYKGNEGADWVTQAKQILIDLQNKSDASFDLVIASVLYAVEKEETGAGKREFYVPDIRTRSLCTILDRMCACILKEYMRKRIENNRHCIDLITVPGERKMILLSDSMKEYTNGMINRFLLTLDCSKFGETFLNQALALELLVFKNKGLMNEGEYYEGITTLGMLSRRLIFLSKRIANMIKNYMVQKGTWERSGLVGKISNRKRKCIPLREVDVSMIENYEAERDLYIKEIEKTTSKLSEKFYSILRENRRKHFKNMMNGEIDKLMSENKAKRMPQAPVNIINETTEKLLNNLTTRIKRTMIHSYESNSVRAGTLVAPHIERENGFVLGILSTLASCIALSCMFFIYSFVKWMGLDDICTFTHSDDGAIITGLELPEFLDLSKLEHFIELLQEGYKFKHTYKTNELLGEQTFYRFYKYTEDNTEERRDIHSSQVIAFLSCLVYLAPRWFSEIMSDAKFGVGDSLEILQSYTANYGEQSTKKPITRVMFLPSLPSESQAHEINAVCSGMLQALMEGLSPLEFYTCLIAQCKLVKTLWGDREPIRDIDFLIPPSIGGIPFAESSAYLTRGVNEFTTRILSISYSEKYKFLPSNLYNLLLDSEYSKLVKGGGFTESLFTQDVSLVGPHIPLILGDLEFHSYFQPMYKAMRVKIFRLVKRIQKLNLISAFHGKGKEIAVGIKKIEDLDLLKSNQKILLIKFVMAILGPLSISGNSEKWMGVMHSLSKKRFDNRTSRKIKQRKLGFQNSMQTNLVTEVFLKETGLPGVYSVKNLIRAFINFVILNNDMLKTKYENKRSFLDFLLENQVQSLKNSSGSFIRKISHTLNLNKWRVARLSSWIITDFPLKWLIDSYLATVINNGRNIFPMGITTLDETLKFVLSRDNFIKVLSDKLCMDSKSPEFFQIVFDNIRTITNSLDMMSGVRIYYGPEEINIATMCANFCPEFGQEVEYKLESTNVLREELKFEHQVDMKLLNTCALIVVGKEIKGTDKEETYFLHSLGVKLDIIRTLKETHKIFDRITGIRDIETFLMSFIIRINLGDISVFQDINMISNGYNCAIHYREYQMMIYKKKIFVNDLFINDNELGEDAWKRYFVIFFTICNKYLLLRKNRIGLKLNVEENDKPSGDSMRRAFGEYTAENYQMVEEEDKIMYDYLDFRVNSALVWSGSIEVNNLSDELVIKTDTYQRLCKIARPNSNEYIQATNELLKYEIDKFVGDYSELELGCIFNYTGAKTYYKDMFYNKERPWYIQIWMSRNISLAIENNLLDKVSPQGPVYFETEVLRELKSQCTIFHLILERLTPWCRGSDRDNLEILVLLIVAFSLDTTRLTPIISDTRIIKQLNDNHDSYQDDEFMSDLDVSEIKKLYKIRRLTELYESTAYNKLKFITEPYRDTVIGRYKKIADRQHELSYLNCTMETLFPILGIKGQILRRYYTTFNRIDVNLSEEEANPNRRFKGIRWAKLAARSLKSDSRKLEEIVKVIKNYRLKNFYNEKLLLDNIILESFYTPQQPETDQIIETDEIIDVVTTLEIPEEGISSITHEEGFEEEEEGTALISNTEVFSFSGNYQFEF